MKNWGVSGNTILDTRKGYMKIDDLIGSDNQWILFHNSKENVNVYRKANNIRVCGKYGIVEIELIEGNKFRVADESKFYLKNDESIELIEAKDIKKDNMIFGSKYYYKVKEVYSKVKETIYNLDIPDIHNFFIFDENYLGNFTGILIKCN